MNTTQYKLHIMNTTQYKLHIMDVFQIITITSALSSDTGE